MAHIAPSEANALALLARPGDGPIVMLNLLRFRAYADYTPTPHLAPDAPITGRAAYGLYEAGMIPMLAASGGDILLSGVGGAWFIGPESERWDRVLLVRQASVTQFLAFAQDPAATELGHHRTAALADSRLLPLTPD